MKTLVKTFLSLALTISLFSFCQKAKVEENISGEINSQSDCKSFKSAGNTMDTADTLSCVAYKFIQSESKLLLTHQNTGFNCCPGELTCIISFENDTIFIQEFEESALCNCNCRFDIDIEISGIEAKTYFLKFIEPYCGDQEKLYFGIDLINESEGSYCAFRNDYPWGITGNYELE